jgi:hypothetical protein
MDSKAISLLRFELNFKFMDLFYTYLSINAHL